MANMNTPLDSHRTLWMGDLQKEWDADFVANSFKHLGHDPMTVKMVVDKHTGITSGYCFVEFADSDAARKAMLNANGNVVNNSDPPARYNLSFANDPRVPSIEYNLFVNNLSLEIDDADLYQVFGHRYKSCRGAKVYRNADGSSRGLGFVRFGDQTEQQMALVEMNRTIVRGMEMQLKLAAAKQRLPRSQISQGQKPFLIHDQNMPSVRSHHQPQQPLVPQQPVEPPQPQFASLNYPTADEDNEKIIAEGDCYHEELEESRWSLFVFDTNFNERALSSALQENRW